MTTRAKEVVTKDQLVEQLHTVVADTEQLLKSVATAGGEKAGDLRASVEQGLSNAKARMRDLQHTAVARSRQAARDADGYVHEHPWRMIGIVAGATALIGVALSLLVNRR